MANLPIPCYNTFVLYCFIIITRSDIFLHILFTSIHVSVCSYDEASAHLCICVIAANFLSPPRRWPSFANTAIGNQLFQWFTLLHKSSHQFGLVLTSCSIHAAGKKVFWYPTPFWWDPRKLTQAKYSYSEKTKLSNRPTNCEILCLIEIR